MANAPYKGDSLRSPCRTLLLGEEKTPEQRKILALGREEKGKLDTAAAGGVNEGAG